MRTWRFGIAAGALAAALVGITGCGNEHEEGAAAPPQAPGDTLGMHILSVTLPAGDGARPVVRFRVTDINGNPINLANEVAASNASPPGIPNTVPRFTLAQRDDRNDHRSYYASLVSSKPYTVPAGEVAPPSLPSALQPSYQPPARDATGKAAAWPVGDLKDVGGGDYEFTMPPINQTGFDRTKTHTLAGWTVRSTAAGTADIAHASFNFVPNGGTATTFETITDSGCNRCHGQLQAHGTRRGTQLCITCHNPFNTDPDTSRPLDFKVMVHKIHSGETLPTVLQGKGYFIVGFNQVVADFSDLAFPWQGGVRDCTVCHTGANADNWKSLPTLNVCTACHDNVKFTTAEASTACASLPANQKFQDCLHDGGPITVTDTRDTTTCKGCHGPGTAAAVDKFHGSGM